MDDYTFFKRNPNSNYRIRKPGDGEVDSLCRRMLPPGITLTGPLQPPSQNTEYRICILKTSDSKFIRLLLLSEVIADTDCQSGPFDLEAVGLAAIKFGSRLVMVA